MQAIAIIKNVGISPKKTRVPAMIIKGMKVDDALNTLKFMQKGTAAHVYKAVKSAAANAIQKQAKLETLVVSEVRIDKGGNRIKHYHPRAKGGGYYGWLRGKSNITVVVSDGVIDEVKQIKKEKKVEKTEVKVEKAEKVTKKTAKTVKKSKE
ncbi:MAG: uL22 family ribosomal protein [Candidatus Dojkabacteria bacterium]